VSRKQPRGGRKHSPEVLAKVAHEQDRRRRLVGQLLAMQYMTQREIAAEVERLGCRNPETGKPWSLGTINADMQWLRELWLDRTAEDVKTAKSRQLAEIAQLKRECWARGNLKELNNALKLEAQILGTNAPVKIAPTTPAGDEPYGPTFDVDDLRARIMARALSLASEPEPGATSGDAGQPDA
jgi:hypothetical protein